MIAYARGRYRVLGETLDIGVGNFLDKLWIGLGGTFPGGPAIEAEALLGKELLPLPYSVHGMDVAFSGMLTATLALHAKGASRPDLAYSVEATCVLDAHRDHRARPRTSRPERGRPRRRGRVQRTSSRHGPNDGREPRRDDVRAPEVVVRRQRSDDRLDRSTSAFGAGVTSSVEASAVQPRQRTDLVSTPWRAD